MELVWAVDRMWKHGNALTDLPDFLKLKAQDTEACNHGAEPSHLQCPLSLLSECVPRHLCRKYD